MWDLAGQDRFNHLSRLYFNKAAGALLVCDQNTEKSLEGIIKWKKELDQKLNYNIPSVIICNKEDIREKSSESDDDLLIEEMARDLGVCAWTRTSAKTGAGVEEGIRCWLSIYHQFENDGKFQNPGMADAGARKRVGLR